MIQRLMTSIVAACNIYAKKKQLKVLGFYCEQQIHGMPASACFILSYMCFDAIESLNFVVISQE